MLECKGRKNVSPEFSPISVHRASLLQKKRSSLFQLSLGRFRTVENLFDFANEVLLLHEFTEQTGRRIFAVGQDLCQTDDVDRAALRLSERFVHASQRIAFPEHSDPMKRRTA